MKVLKITTSLFVVIAIILCSFAPVYAVPESDLNVNKSVMAERLISKLESASNTDVIEVVIWIKDINHEEVETEVAEKTGVKKVEINDALGMEKIKNYVSEKRSLSMKKYKTSNAAFLSKITKSNSVKVVFQSSLSPMIILSANKADIYSVAKNTDVVTMDLFVNSQLVSASSEANANSSAIYMRDTIGATGTYTSNGSSNKIKIGQIELATPDFDGYESYFDTGDCYSHGAQSIWQDDIDHATLVAAIMVGKSVTYGGNTYKGIVPNAELHSHSITDDLSLFNAAEYLISNCGVEIINMSAVNYGRLGSYDEVSKWIDHIAYKHDVHFVVAAGNIGPEESPYGYVASPGMSYNAITVGNYQNENIASGNRYTMTSHAPSILDDQKIPATYGRMYYSCFDTFTGQCKPDISAEGTKIRYGVFEDSGTSFAAPQVAGIIAQLCSKYPSLLTKQSTVKAILAASSVYRVSNDLYYSNTYLLDKQGSGVVNSRAAYAVLLGGKYVDITLPNTTQYYTKTITVPSSYTYLRVAMSWIKKNDATGTSGALGECQALANLKLEVFKGTGTSGTTVYTSDASNNNLELVQFDVNGGGTYTIRITNQSYNNSSITGNQYISLAWY